MIRKQVIHFGDDRIRKTATYISQKTSLKAIPLIISSQDCNKLKNSLQDVLVIIDIKDINKRLKLIKYTYLIFTIS